MKVSNPSFNFGSFERGMKHAGLAVVETTHGANSWKKLPHIPCLHALQKENKELKNMIKELEYKISELKSLPGGPLYVEALKQWNERNKE